MKVPHFHRFTLLFAAFLGLAANSVHSADVEGKIREIRTRYEAIEKAKLSRESIAFEAEDEPVSGECTLYRQGDEVLKAVFTYGGEHGANEESYYSQGLLIFVFASDGSWNFTGRTLPDGQSETVDAVTEHRVYLDGDEIVRHRVKEAKSTDGAKLPGILAKTENRPGDSGERIQRLRRIGAQLPQVRGPKDLEKILIAP